MQTVRLLCMLASLLLFAGILIDSFETILQPRRVVHRFRLARFFYRNTWKLWRAAALLIKPGKRREGYLSIFGPLSLLGLFGVWVIGLIFSFALLHWSVQTTLHAPEQPPTFLTYLYFSGATFLTVGASDIAPAYVPGRALAVIEAGLGFAFLAVIISYLPVLYEAFSQREIVISLLDARAGSPPSAAEAILRPARSGAGTSVESFLREWERWAAELLESHLSFPVLSYYRSQHDNQSWLAALTTMLDTTALLLAEVKLASSYQAQLTFAIARHAAVDLCLVLKTPATAPQDDRLPPAQRQRLRTLLRQAGVELRDETSEAREASDAKLTELRAMYEPFVNALAQRFLFALPQILPPQVTADNWQRSAWMQRTPGIGSLSAPAGDETDHFG